MIHEKYPVGRSIVGSDTLCMQTTDYRTGTIQLGSPKKRGASYWGERANNEEKVKKWRERWERCVIMKQIIFASQTFSREIWTKDEKRGAKVFKMILFGWRNLLKINMSKQWEKNDGRDMSKRYRGMRKRWERRKNEPFCRGELFPRPPGAGPVKNHRASVAPATNMCEEEWQLRGIYANVSSYLIFVIFLHKQNFWRIKFTPKNA